MTLPTITFCCPNSEETAKKQTALARAHLDYSAHLLETQGLTDEAVEDAARGIWHLEKALAFAKEAEGVPK